LTISLPFQPKLGLGGELGVLVVVVLDAAVVVLVLELQQAGGLPLLEPLRAIRVQQVALLGTDRAGLDGVHQVQTRHGADGRGGGVEQRDEDQRPAGGVAGVLATFGTVKKRMMTCGRPAVPIISDRV
jgi:hypothetical protein